MSSGNTEAGPRDLQTAIVRGLRLRCPKCGEGRIFRAYLKVNNYCPSCGEALYHHRADDAPPYVVITIVGHIIVGLMLTLEKTYPINLYLQAAIWLPLTVILCLVLLPPVKGALIGLQWALKMHGFDPESPEAREPPTELQEAPGR